MYENIDVRVMVAEKDTDAAARVMNWPPIGRAWITAAGRSRKNSVRSSSRHFPKVNGRGQNWEGDLLPPPLFSAVTPPAGTQK